MEYRNITNPRWANEEQTLIDCDVEIKINGLFETVPFTASASDPEKHGRDIFKKTLKGEVKDYYLDPAIKKQNRIQEIQFELLTIDKKRIRPMAEGDTEFLNNLNLKAANLRQELKDL
jgi:hypothetical protein